MIRQLLSLLCLSALFFAGCGGDSTPTEAPPADANGAAEVEAVHPDLTGTNWELESIGEPGNDVQALPEVRSTLNFLVDRYAGSGGCNFYLGVYTADTRAITMQTPATTAIICEDTAVSEQDGTFMTALLNVIAYEITEDKLIGYTAGDQRLLTMVSAQPVPLQGTTWGLKLISTEGEWFPVIPDSRVTLVGDGERFSGIGGCNEYSATIVRAGDAVSLTDFVAGEQSCSNPDGIMDQENMYFSILRSAQRYVELAGALIVVDADGGPALVFGVQ